jgi:hypothetical protein
MINTEWLDWLISFFRWLSPAPELGEMDNLPERLHLWWAYRPLKGPLTLPAGAGGMGERE